MADRRYRLTFEGSGEPTTTTLTEFFAENEDLDADERHEIALALATTGSFTGGGGAGIAWTLECLPPTADEAMPVIGAAVARLNERLRQRERDRRAFVIASAGLSPPVFSVYDDRYPHGERVVCKTEAEADRAVDELLHASYSPEQLAATLGVPVAA